MLNKKSAGSIAETFAVNFLKRAGYEILTRNFRSKFGEIDIVAKKNNVLVFVEVKARWSKKFGLPVEAVTPRKIAKIKRVGEYYSLTHLNLPAKRRIDVVSIQIDNGGVANAKIIKVI